MNWRNWPKEAMRLALDGIADTAVMIGAVEWISGLSDAGIDELQNYQYQVSLWKCGLIMAENIRYA